MSVSFNSFLGLKLPSRRSKAWGLVSRASQPTGGCSCRGSSRCTRGSTTCSSEYGAGGARTRHRAVRGRAERVLVSFCRARSVWFCGWSRGWAVNATLVRRCGDAWVCYTVWWLYLESVAFFSIVLSLDFCEDFSLLLHHTFMVALMFNSRWNLPVGLP